MTSREMLNIIINGGEITTEVKDKAAEMLNAIEKKTENRSKKSAENKSANIGLANQLIAVMENRTYGASELFQIATANEIEGITTLSKVSAVCKVAVDEGLMTATENYKVGGKGRSVKGYSKV